MGAIFLGVAAALLGLLLLTIALTPEPADGPTYRLADRLAYRFTGFAPPILLFVLAALLIFGGLT